LEYIAGDYICYDCINDKIITRLINEQNKVQECKKCGEDKPTIEFTELADMLDNVYRKYYKPGQESLMMLGIAASEQIIGDYPEEIIQEILEVDLDIAESLANYLHSEERYSVAKGATAMYEPGNKYMEKNISNTKLHKKWETFEDSIKFEQRFFDDENKNLIDQLFEDIKSYADQDVFTTELNISENDDVYVYRARKAASKKQAEKIIEELPNSMGMPPKNKSKGGRMNPPGISMFYGAFTKKTCINEVRPVVGGLVVLAKFKVENKVRLLDLPKFEHGQARISKFNSDYEEIMQKWSFFRDFHKLITKPVKPAEKFLEYVPTQVVAEYFSKKLDYDGIIYSSSQTKKDMVVFEAETSERKDNIAFFNPLQVIINGHSDSSRDTADTVLSLQRNNVEVKQIDAVEYFSSSTSID